MSGKRENEKIKNKVIAMQAKFVDTVEPKDVLDLLVQEGIVKKECKEKIMNKETKQDRCRALLDFLEDCSNEKAFITLKGALQDHYLWIVELIDAPDAGKDNEDESTTGMEQLKKELDMMRTQLQGEVDDLKIELQSTKNKLKEANRYIEILEKDRDIQPRCELCIHKKPQTSAMDTFRENKHVSNEESTIFESCIIMVGTVSNNVRGNDVIKINLNRANEVSTIGQLPLPVDGDCAAIAYDNSLFVSGVGVGQIWKFDAQSSNWECCNTMIQGRRRHSVAFVNHILYMCGGLSKDGKKLLDVESYDTIDNRCTTVGKLAHAVHSSGNCVPFKSSLYIFGGMIDAYRAVDYIQVYDTQLNSCTLLSQRMPVADSHFRSVLWENKAILRGFNYCLIFNFDNRTLQMKDLFNTIHFCFGMALHEGKLFVIGGGEYTRKDVSHRARNYSRKIDVTLRDDIIYTPVANVLSGEPIEWKHHSNLPVPSPVFAFGKLQFPMK